MDSTWIGQIEATTRWKAARVRLSEAIQEFSEATSIFTRAILAPAPLGKFEFDVESTLDGLDLELQQLASEGNKLNEAHTRLKVARDFSKHVVLINRLPLGVLYQIFDLVAAWANDCCDRIRTPYMPPEQNGHDCKTRIIALTSVCTTWRRIIIAAPSYWSHIDTRLAVGADDWTCMPTEYSTLCLQRANNTPLDLHVYCVPKRILRSGLPTCPFPQCFRDQIIYSISFVLNCDWNLVESILGAWRATTPNSRSEKPKSQESKIVQGGYALVGL